MTPFETAIDLYRKAMTELRASHGRETDAILDAREVREAAAETLSTVERLRRVIEAGRRREEMARFVDGAELGVPFDADDSPAPAIPSGNTLEDGRPVVEWLYNRAEVFKAERDLARAELAEARRRLADAAEEILDYDEALARLKRAEGGGNGEG
jgi:hypothetical protein